MLNITSPHNPTIKLIRSLADKKHRTDAGLFVAEGPKVLARARIHGWVPKYLLSTGMVDAWGDAALMKVDEKLMASISAQRNPPSMIGVFQQKWGGPVAPSGVWIALEEMRDPGNLGTIIRTADAAGAAGVILVGQTCDPWSPECIRATMGSIFATPLASLDQRSFLDLCNGWPGDVVGADMGGEQDFRRMYRHPTLVVMGSEGSGLSSEVAAVCSSLVRIPMKGDIESLNVAMASALMLYEVIKP